MNLSKKLPLAFVVVLIAISLTGLFEESALEYVKSVFEKNLKFMALTAEMKVVVSGLSSIKLPMLDGITKDINVELNKVMQYLLLSDIISFLQVMLLSVSKSWLLKLLTLTLFLLSFVNSTKAICTKLLVLSLSISPGLAIYSLGVQHLAQTSSINFGEKYLKKLEVKVDAVKAEKAELMKQHQSDLTKINNGQKGIHILQKFREDVSYDFKRVRNDIRGAHTHIRLFLHDSGHEMKSKIYGFCSMVIFCMLILPMGYAFLINILISSMFSINSMHLKALVPQSIGHDVEKDPNKSSFGQKLKRVFKVYLEEFHSVENKTVRSGIVQRTADEVEEIKQKVTSEIKEGIGGEMQHLDTKITETTSQIQSEVAEKKDSEEKVVPKTTSAETEQKTTTNKSKQGGKPPSTLSI